MILGVILAGGQARRMGGGDKSLLRLGGRPILEHVIERLGPQVDSLALSANGDPSRFAAFGLPVIADGSAGRVGPLAGVLAGLDWAAGIGASAIVTAAADTPFLPRDLVAVLCRAAAARCVAFAIATTPGSGKPERHPAFALWPVAHRDTLRAALEAGERRAGLWAVAQGAAEAPFNEAAAFININTPDDLARAEALLAHAGPLRRGLR